MITWTVIISPFKFQLTSYPNAAHLYTNSTKQTTNYFTRNDTDIDAQDELEEPAVTFCDNLMKAVSSSTPQVYSRNDPKTPISQAILDLINEKRRLRRLYNITQDPDTKTSINRLQKEIRTKINEESSIGKNSATLLA